MSVRTSGSPHHYNHRPIALLAPTAVVQNTWYTVLDTTERVRLIMINMRMATNIETLQVQITIDGVVLAGEQVAAVVGTDYKAVLTATAYAQSLGIVSSADTAFLGLRPFLLEGRSVKVEVRKTTVVGAGNMTASVVYAVRD